MINLKKINYILFVLFLGFVILPISKIAAGNYYAKVIFIGDWWCGKTTLRERYMSNDFVYGRPHTIDFDAKQRFIEYNGHNISLKLWDTAGEERYHSVVKSFFRGVQFAFFVVDMRESLDSPSNLKKKIERWIEELKEGTPSARGAIIGTRKDQISEYLLNKNTDIIKRTAGYANCPYAILSGKKDSDWWIQHELDRCIKEMLDEKDVGISALSFKDNDAGFKYVERIPEPKKDDCC